MNRTALAAILLAACTTPTLEDLTRVEVRIVRAPPAAASAQAEIAGLAHDAALEGRAATIRFATRPPAGTRVRVTVLDADGHALESAEQEAQSGEGRLVVEFDFRPCETDPRFGAACTVGLGTCEMGALWRCAADHVSLECPAHPLDAGTEECNGLDDDCDGRTDDDVEARAPACELARGVCATGRRACLGREGWSSCDYGPAFERTESLCDGKDNDCDGQTDPMLGREPATCRSCTAGCSGEEACVSGRCHDAPVVVETSVRDGEWGVETGRTLAIRFSRPMDRATTEAAVSLAPPAAFTRHWNTESTTLELRTDGSLGAGAGYALVMGGAARDARGKSLAAEQRVTFATAPTRGLFVFGGSCESPPYFRKDSWVLVLPAGLPPRWYRLDSGTGPGERSGALAAWDGRRGRVFLFGGTPSLSQPVSELWSLGVASGAMAANWSRHLDDVPGTGRARAIGGIDSDSDALVATGGLRGGACLTDALSIPLASMGPRAVAMNGQVRGLFLAVGTWHAASRTAWVTQGYGDRSMTGCWSPAAGSNLQNPLTWRLTLGEAGFAVEQSPAQHPMPQGQAAAATDGTRLVVYGGEGSSHADEAWVLEGTEWRKLVLSGDGPGPMRAGSMIWDPAGGRFVTFGGDSPNDAKKRNAVHALVVNGTQGTWTRLSPENEPPAARTSFAWTAVDDAGLLVPVK